MSSGRSAPPLRLEPGPDPAPGRLGLAVRAAATLAVFLALPPAAAAVVASAALGLERLKERRQPCVRRALWRSDGGWSLWLAPDGDPLEARLVRWQPVGSWIALEWRAEGAGRVTALWTRKALGAHGHRRLRQRLRLSPPQNSRNNSILQRLVEKARKERPPSPSD